MNILCNGAMEIDQANEGALITLPSGTDIYTCDAWVTGVHSASGAATAQRVSDAPPGFSSSIKVIMTTGASSIAAIDYLGAHQAIEANELIGIGLGSAGARTLYLRFWAKCSIAPYTMTYVLLNDAVNRSWIGEATISVANQWQEFVVSFPADVAGSWMSAGAGIGAYLRFGFAAGSNYVQATGVWGTANAVGTPGSSNGVMTTSGATIQVSGARLALSDGPFSRGSANELIGRCQRYLSKSYDLGVATRAATADGISLLSSLTECVRFATPMRVASSVTLISPVTGAFGKAYDYINSADVTASLGQIGTRGFYWYASPAAPGVINIGAHFVVDARLP